LVFRLNRLEPQQHFNTFLPSLLVFLRDLQYPVQVLLFATMSRSLAALCLLFAPALAANFTIFNGQIFTPGFAILDAPQPGTPLGGG
jgi:hypothetical protein